MKNKINYNKENNLNYQLRTIADDYEIFIVILILVICGVIICDEFGGKDDLENAMFAMKSGVNVIASMHSLDVNDFLNKPCSKELIQSGVFEYGDYRDRTDDLLHAMQALSHLS